MTEEKRPEVYLVIGEPAETWDVEDINLDIFGLEHTLADAVIAAEPLRALVVALPVVADFR